jgi:hypothetical protein
MYECNGFIFKTLDDAIKYASFYELLTRCILGIVEVKNANHAN